MVYINSNDAATTNPTFEVSSASIKSAFNMDDKIEQVKDYFASIDGTPNAFDNIKPKLEKLFHRDLVVESDGNKIPYDDFVIIVSKFAANACVAELVDIQDNGDGTVKTIVNNRLPGENGDITRQCYYFKDGAIVRVVAQDSDVGKFGAMLDRVSELPADDIADKYASFLGCFDGSIDAFEKGERILDEIFHPDLVIVHGDEKMKMAEFKAFATTFAKNRNVAKLEKLERTDLGFRVVIRNIVAGIDQGPVEQFGSVKDGRIVYWAATPTNEAGLARLVDSVTNNA